jgi:hypothetical protein
MPIRRLLADGDFTAEQRHVLELAFDNILSKLSLVDRNDPLCELIARKVVDVGKDGYDNAVVITEAVVRQFRE